MTTLRFKRDSDAKRFAGELLEAHDRTQICYKYERDCVVEFWWEYQTDVMSDDRDWENESRSEAITKLFDYLDNSGIEYEL